MKTRNFKKISLALLACFMACVVVLLTTSIANASQPKNNNGHKSLYIKGYRYIPLFAPGQDLGDIVLYRADGFKIPKKGNSYCYADLVEATEYTGNAPFRAIKLCKETWDEAFSPHGEVPEGDCFNANTYRGKNMLPGEVCECLTDDARHFLSLYGANCLDYSKEFTWFDEMWSNNVWGGEGKEQCAVKFVTSHGVHESHYIQYNVKRSDSSYVLFSRMFNVSGSLSGQVHFNFCSFSAHIELIDEFGDVIQSNLFTRTSRWDELKYSFSNVFSTTPKIKVHIWNEYSDITTDYFDFANDVKMDFNL